MESYQFDDSLNSYLDLLINLNPAEYFTVHQPPLSSRASSSILIKPFKYHLFFYRSIDCWNSLSLTIKQSKSLNVFKNNLNSYNLTTFLKGSAFNMS